MVISFIPDSQGCDFQVADPAGKPLFRLVLPETLYENRSVPVDHIIHTYPGIRIAGQHAASCVIERNDRVSYESDLSEADADTLKMSISVKNHTGRVLRDLRLDICQAPGCLPGYPDPWANTDFMPAGLPLDRDIQGREWYEQVSVNRQRGLAGGEWIVLHPSPACPRIDEQNKYPLITGDQPDAAAVALLSIDRATILYMAWAVPCYWRAPFPGNACMHIMPALPDLQPGGRCAITGQCGLFYGSLAQLAERLNRDGR